MLVSYDRGYDEPGRSLTKVSCSDGVNGLMTRFHWDTQDDIPIFPFIGGAQAVSGWNSTECGSCWQIEYQGTKITVMAIDHADNGFNIGFRAMDRLTNGQASQAGAVEAVASRVDNKACGI